MTEPSFCGVVAALHSEASCLASLKADAGMQADIPGGRLWLSGMGADAARIAAQGLVDAGATALLSWGSCGGLVPYLKAGDVLLPARVLNEAGEVYTTDVAWGARLYERLRGRVQVDGKAVVMSVEKPCGTLPHKARLSAVADAVDMETAAIAAIAERATIPFLAVRAVADIATRTLPAVATNAVDAIGRPHMATLAVGLLRRPQEFFALPGVGRDFSHAMKALRLVAEQQPAVLAYRRTGRRA